MSSDSIPKVVSELREAFASGTTKSYEWRIQQLKQLRKLVADNEEKWHEALVRDLKQTEFLKLIETKSCLGDIDNAIANLWDWMKPESRNNNVIANIPGSAYIVPEPFGIVLIIAPWNYPIQLLVRPLVGAIAAGNAVVLKPSEVSETVSKLFAELTPKYLDQRFIKCIEGGIPETTTLLGQKWDYIFYTGSTGVGKIIMEAASKHLTPVTLELGGKSPCIIDKDVNLDIAIRRIIWGKMLNCGQSCIAPDYLLVHKEVEPKLVSQIKKQLSKFYSSTDLKKEKHISRIITKRHTERIKKMLDSCKDHVVMGGEVDVDEKFVSPTLIKNPKEDSEVMKEEIFGPLLPYIVVDDVDEAIQFINKRDKPLALYIFSNDRKLQDKVMKSTSSGTVCINDTMLQFTVPDLPFGGVGSSGMGSYNGKKSFETFSHPKSVFDRPNIMDLDLRYPPYEGSKVTILRYVLGKSLPTWGTIKTYAIPAVVVAGSVVTYMYSQSKM